jgi:Family of unknown function (DUF6088)
MTIVGTTPKQYHARGLKIAGRRCDNVSAFILESYIWGMTTPDLTHTSSHPVTSLVRQRIDRSGDQLWRLEDFRDLPFAAVAQALSRLTRQGALERLSKGLYYRTRETAFGKSRPNPAAIQKLATRRKSVFPSGIAAANLLGFTTQSAKQGELATSALSLPRKLVGGDTVVHTRRPHAWATLSETDAALLDFLRRGGRTSELSPEENHPQNPDVAVRERAL